MSKKHKKTTRADKVRASAFVNFNRQASTALATPLVDEDDIYGTAEGAVVGRNADFDEDRGFVRLAPTPVGRASLERIRMRRAASVAEVAPEAIDIEPVESKDSYDCGPTEAMLAQCIVDVKDRKFTRALGNRNMSMINALATAFLDNYDSITNAAHVREAVLNVIRIGKSFYEYDDRGREFVNDELYDALIGRIRKMGIPEPVGFVPVSDKKTGIRYPLLHNNMDKAYCIYETDQIPEGVKETDRIQKWMVRNNKKLGITSEVKVRLGVKPKIDGVSVNGTARGDYVSEPQTRGDNDASMYIKGMDGMQLQGYVEGTPEFGIQWEAFCTDEDRINASLYLKLATPYVSCRHAASGIINRLISTEDDETAAKLTSFLHFYPIEAMGVEGTYEERMDLISNYGKVPKDMLPSVVIEGNMNECLKKIAILFDEWGKLREKLSYAIDGLVITYLNDDDQKTIGREGRTNLYQIALKFDPACAEGTVKDVYLDTGKKGFRTIQVELEHPVFLGGVRYPHIPVLSLTLFEKLQLRKGTVVKVMRTGDVMPAISVKAAGKGKLIKTPTICPKCGKWLMVKDSKLYCSNPQCTGNMVGRIHGYMIALGLDGYGEDFAETLVERFGPESTIKDPPRLVRGMGDLYDLTVEDFEKVGMKGKMAREFPDLLKERTRVTSDVTILGAIGILGVGPARARQILKEYGGWDEFIYGLSTATMDMHLIRALGEAIGTKVFQALRCDDGSESIIEDLKKVTKFMDNFTTNFDEKKLRIGHTGGILDAAAVDVCNRNDFEIVDGKNFDVLITSDLESNSTKMKRAREKGLPIYTQDMFVALYANKEAS